MRISDWSSDVCSSDLEAVALAEVLVDDEAVGQAQARRQAHAARARGRAFLAERDHVVAEDAGAGAGAADVHAARVALADQLGRSEEHTSELQSLMRISYAVFCLKKKTLPTTK